MMIAAATVHLTPDTPRTDALLERVRAEFKEMPGLRLTCQQASRLWHLDQRTCLAALQTLVGEHFLLRTATGAFVRADRT